MAFGVVAWYASRGLWPLTYPFLAVGLWNWRLIISSQLFEHSGGNRRSLGLVHHQTDRKTRDCGVVAAVTVLAGTRPSPGLTPIAPVVSAKGTGAPDARRLHHYRINEKHRTTILDTHPPSLSGMLSAVRCHSLKCPSSGPLLRFPHGNDNMTVAHVTPPSLPRYTVRVTVERQDG
jgi:hypothetical protein